MLGCIGTTDLLLWGELHLLSTSTMFIYDFPAELLFTILELCQHRDAYALALCCHDAYHALESVLSKHQRLWRCWNTIDSDDSRRSFHNRVLKLTRNQQLACYIETLSFDCELEERAYSESECMEMLERLRELSDMYGDIFDVFQHRSWQDNLYVGLQHTPMRWLSTYLVSMAPNLRRLECFGSTVGDDDLLFVLVSAARASLTMAKLPMQHLRVVEVRLDRGFDEGGLPMDWLLASMCLPSVRTFAASRMNASRVFMDKDEVRNANLETLILEDSFFEPDDLVFVLGKINNLKIFAYSDGQYSNVSEGGSFSPKRITSALSLYAGHSLEHLIIHGRDEDVSLDY
jgi:hypothetical protein